MMLARLTISFIAISLMTGCGTRELSPEEAILGSPNFQPDPSLVYAQEWSKIIVVANSSKTEIRLSGHVSTSRNTCGFPKDGVLDVAIWNRFATQANRALSIHALGAENCDLSFELVRIDGTVDAVSDNVLKHLFSVKDGKICTTILDLNLAAELLKSTEEIVKYADKIDCPNGWGSDT